MMTRWQEDALAARIRDIRDGEHQEGYLDGRDRNTPEPSANRSHAYRQSFSVGRAEIAGNPIPAAQSRLDADEADRKDSER